MKMVKNFYSAVFALVGAFLINGSVHAQIVDEQILDLYSGEVSQLQNAQKLTDDFQFESFSSCQQFEDVFEKFVKENRISNRNYFGYYGRGGFGLATDDAMQSDLLGGLTTSEAGNVKTADQAVSQSADFSTTNIQKEGVDEPEILKTDGKFVYYFNQETHKIYVINSPVDLQTRAIDLSKAEIKKIIPLPESFSQVQLFVYNGKLIVTATRYRSVTSQSNYLDNSQRSVALVYDTTNFEKAKVLKLTDVSGYLLDARITNGKLYLISKVGMGRGPVYAYENKIDSFSVNGDVLMPRGVDVVRTADEKLWNVKRDGKQVEYNSQTAKIDCNDIFYLLPTKESLQKNPVALQFTVVSVIDLNDVTQPVKMKALFGDAQQIHVSQKGLYVVNGFYHQQAFSCPINARCMMPFYAGGENALVHKFQLGAGVDYVGSTIVPGQILNQYSMDEDEQGNFRILTKQRYPKLSTHLFIMDSSLKLVGKLLGIQPGEEFKSSRFIGKMLYLVTFKQIDPLFVVDIKNAMQPKIVGELKIPGFSTYLHPYGTENAGVQYLLGLGYDTKTNQRGGTVTNGIKLDLIKVDYTKDATPETQCGSLAGMSGYQECISSFHTGFVETKLVQSMVMGEQGSWTEALDNPRTFVWNNSTKELLLPVLLAKSNKQKNCSIQYDDQGAEISRDCRDYDNPTTQFAGVKLISVDVSAGFKEKMSIDYTEMFKKANGTKTLQTREFIGLMSRVGYLGDVFYTLNTKFGHFYLPTNFDGKYVPFVSNLGYNKPAQCKYEESTVSQTDSQMACGQRWIYNKDSQSCEQKEISSAASCPGFETEFACQDMCQK
ncbi:MAG TPA: beta-propeller domain-containing protein [Candidatus Absconditabacterales bacterium]|nr:beta-propeller domain-containing protein [Candidatus Absconditabacterales bacterium]